MKRFGAICLAVVCGGLFGATPFVHAVAVSNYAVLVSATVQTSPASISLAWTADSSASSYTIYRKSLSATSWGAPIATINSPLAASATSYLDLTPTVGQTYEYYVMKTASTYYGDGYIYAGIQAPMTENRGKVVLLVDSTHTVSLAPELIRLQQDLVGDGWTVLRHDVARMAVDPANTSSSVWTARANELSSIKNIIKADYNADPVNVKAVFLIGHIPVPYSGNLAPDNHLEHVGAWPADSFYGDMDGTWTDTSVVSVSVGDQRTRNEIGDGKFDQTELPSDLELQVGRVDFANMPAFSPQSESDLLRRYLNKDHGFRHTLIGAQRRGLINDHLGILGGTEPIAANGWENFAPFFGAANITSGEWLPTLNTQSYLWGYGCGGGTYTSAYTYTTAQLATVDPQVVFTMWFGSYFGDWDSQNNFLRAQLGTPNYTLTSVWAGRPFWQFHHMGLGETIGYSYRVTENNTGLYYAYNFNHYVHTALMGDPTLRMHPVIPPSSLTAFGNPSSGINLNWTASSDTVLGYHVYRAVTPAGPFTRRNGSLIIGTSYTDSDISGVASTCTYMVRAVKLETSGSGTYYNASQGIFHQNTAPVAGAGSIARYPTQGVKIALTDLLANATDADGDTLTLSGVGNATPSGASVSRAGNWVFYTPPASSTSPGSFEYSVVDPYNASHSGTVSVTIKNDTDQTLNIVSIKDLTGKFQIVISGIPGRVYRIQYTDNLSNPWQLLVSATADSLGRCIIEDAAGSGARYYRSVYP